MKDNKSVLIVGANFRNKGAAAMAQTAVDELDEAHVTISSIFNEDLEYNDNYEVIKHVRLLELLLIELSFLATGGIFRPQAVYQRWQKKYHQTAIYLSYLWRADVIVDLSGYALTDKFGTLRIWSWVEVLLLTKIVQKPFIMLPQSVGPLSKRRNRIFIWMFLPLADVRTVRGSVSENWLQKVGVENIKMFPDTAFRFEPAPRERGLEILAQLGLDDDKFVTIVPNARLYERWDEYDQELCVIANTIRKSSDCRILVLPHEYTDGGNIDDLFVINQLREHREFEDAIFVEHELTARELKSVVGESELLIGSRLHSTVAGVSMNVPTIAIGWSEKYYEVLEWVNAKDDVWLPETYVRKKVNETVTQRLTEDWNGYSQIDQIKNQAQKSYRLVFSHIERS